MDSLLTLTSTSASNATLISGAIQPISAILGMSTTNSNSCVYAFSNALKASGTAAIYDSVVKTSNASGSNAYKIIAEELRKTVDVCTADRVITLYDMHVFVNLGDKIDDLYPSSGLTTTTKEIYAATTATSSVTPTVSHDAIMTNLDLLNHYMSKYLGGLSSEININTDIITNDVDRLMNSYMITSVTAFSLAQIASAVDVYYINQDSTTETVKTAHSTLINDIVTKSATIFEENAEILVLWFMNKLLKNPPIEYDLTAVKDKVKSSVPEFKEYLAKNLKKFKISMSTTTKTVQLPFSLESGFNPFSAYTINNKHVLKIYTDIVNRFIVYHSVIIAKQMVYEYNNLIYVPMPTDYTKTSVIVYPAKKFKDIKVNSVVTKPKETTVAPVIKKKENNTMIVVYITLGAIIVAAILYYLFFIK